MEAAILVVDDYSFNRLIYRDWLGELKGVTILEAATSELALEMARQHDFALYVVDVAMEGIDGFEFVSRLHAIPGRAVAPVMLVTSQGFERRFQSQGYKAGAAAFVASATTRGDVMLHKAAVFVDLWRQRQGLLAEVADLRRRLEDSDRTLQALRTQATHDPLTRLPNRVLFRDRLQAACARATRARGMFAVGYVDVDRFKAVNDRFGHAAGDQLLVGVASRLARGLRASDSVARLAGDEFGIIVEGIDGSATAETVATKLHRMLSAPYELRVPDHRDKVVVNNTASIGIAMFPDHATESDRLLFRADMAMYAAKEEGEGVRMYGEELINDIGGAETRVPARAESVPQRH